jgi:serine/threonine-protein kinase
LHNQGLIYRDMKPSNIMIEADGGIKLVDFGIAKNFTPTERGTQIGTPGYAPPEQYQGFATPASDIYALAATLHHLLTGRDPTEQPPFSFPPARNLNPAVSVRTSNALEQALKMRPEERFATIAEFRASLRPLAAAKPAQVRVSPQRVAVPAAQTAQAPSPVPQAPPQAAKQAVKEADRRTAASPPRRPTPATRPAVPPARSQRSALNTIVAQIKRFFVRLFATVLVLATLLIATIVGLAIWQPDIVRPYLPAPIEQLLPQADPAPALRTRSFSVELDIRVPANSDREVLRERFRDAYEQAARAQFGDAVIMNRNAPPRYVGAEPVMLGVENGQERWRVTMEGFISAP